MELDTRRRVTNYHRQHFRALVAESFALPPSPAEVHIMPRYFFHVTDGHESFDETGVVLPDAREARAHAIEASGEMLREAGTKFWSGEKWTMRVVDESGAVVCTLDFTARDGAS